MSTTILHSADWHLGKKLWQYDTLADDVVKGAKQVVGYAIRHDVDSLIITGDLFHNHNPSQKTREKAIEVINHLKEDKFDIPVYLVHGDHDHKGTHGTATPGVDAVCAGTHAERLARTPLLINDVAVYGLHNEEIRAFGKSASNQLVDPPSRASQVLLCLHEMHPRWNKPGKPDIDISKVVRNAPFSVDLVACGDVHRKKRWRPLPSCLGRYAGPPSRAVHSNLIEDYEPSAYLYEFSGGNIETEQLPITGLSKRHRVEIDPKHVSCVDDAINCIASAVEPPWKDDLFHIHFTARTDKSIVDGTVDFLIEHGALSATGWDKRKNSFRYQQSASR